MKEILRNKKKTVCVCCSGTLKKGNGRAVGDSSNSPEDFLCIDCWDRIGDHNYSEFK